MRRIIFPVLIFLFLTSCSKYSDIPQSFRMDWNMDPTTYSTTVRLVSPIYKNGWNLSYQLYEGNFLIDQGLWKGIKTSTKTIPVKLLNKRGLQYTLVISGTSNGLDYWEQTQRLPFRR